MKKTFFVIIIYLISNIFTHSQELTYKKYTIADGLPQTQVMEIYQDNKGFIWIITKNGISQFDGIEFKNYTKENGLPDNIVLDVVEDLDGAIWVLSKSGISKFNGNNFIFYPPKDIVHENRFVFPLKCIDGYLWFLSKYQNKVDLISFKEGVYINHSRTNPIIDSLRIKGIQKPKNQAGILLITSNKIYRWNQDKLTDITPEYTIKGINSLSRYYKSFNSLQNPVKKDMDKLESIAKKNILISPMDYTRKDGYVYLLNKRKVVKLNKDHEYLNAFLMDKDSILWIGSEGGLFKYYSEAFLNFTPTHGLNKNIWSVVEDNNGNIWFASFTKGLQMYDGEELHDRNEIFKVRNEPLYIGAKKLSNGTIFFPSNSGVIKWDGKKFSDVEWVNGQTVVVYENTEKNEILVGTAKGLFYNQNGQVKQYKNLTPGKDGYVMDITYDKKGYYWLVTDNTVLRFDGNNFYYFDQDKVPIKDGCTSAIDSSGNIWVGGYEGLFYYNYAKDSFNHALPRELHDVVKFVKVIDQNQILVGRIKNLVIIDLNKFYNHEEDYYRIIDENDGYLGLECKQNGILKDSKGCYWINTSNSVVRFNPEKLEKNNKAPLVYLKSVDVLNDSLNWKTKKSINNYDKISVDTLILSHKSNTFRINYTAISTKNPKEVRYKYKLSGNKNKWSQALTDRMVEFQNVDPGNYTFQLHAGNRNGNWTDEPTELFIIIKPAFWQTLAFKIIMIVLFTGSIILITYFYFKDKARKKEEDRMNQQYYTKLQLNQLIKQFDPHFTFNVVSSIGAHIMNDDKELAYDYLLKLTYLLRSVLEDHEVFMKTIDEEIKFLKNYCEIQKLRLNERFSYTIDVQESVDKNIRIPKMLIQSFVENSIKHGINQKAEGGHVRIAFKEKNNEIITSIRDNGIGRKAAEEMKTSGTRQGQEITNKLFELINKLTKKKIRYEIIDHYDETQKPAGTEVKLYFPINAFHR